VSFVRPELAERLRPWREHALWAAGTAVGLWLMWRGVRGWSGLPLVAGFLIGGRASGCSSRRSGAGG
jgi:hypothetical protein